MTQPAREQVTPEEMEFALEVLIKIDAGHAGLSEWQKSFIADQKARAEKWGPDMRLSPKQLAQIKKAVDVAMAD